MIGKNNEINMLLIAQLVSCQLTAALSIKIYRWHYYYEASVCELTVCLQMAVQW